MTVMNICSANPAMPSAADMTHGPCSPPAKRLPWRLSSIVPIGLQRSNTPFAEAIERSGPEWVAIIPQVARQLAEEE